MKVFWRLNSPVDIARCTKRVKHSKVKASEGAGAITFINKDRVCYSVTRVDGCVINGSLAADYVVARADCGDLIGELKGSSVEHAYKQIEATAKFWKDNDLRCGEMAGVIICSQQPRISTKKQRAKNNFAKMCEGPLHIVSRNEEFIFDHLSKWGSIRKKD